MLLERLLPPLRYPIHGLQMVAAYAGELAAAGTVVVAFLFQAADELRRVERLAYRMRQLQDRDPAFGQGAHTAWMSGPAWQPLRRLVERLLVTWDWGECFVALNLVVKPIFDAFFMQRLARLAEGNGDGAFGKMLFSLDLDGQWQREWSTDLARIAVEEEPGNALVIRRIIEAWSAPTRDALVALRPLFEGVEVTDSDLFQDLGPLPEEAWLSRLPPAGGAP